MRRLLILIAVSIQTASCDVGRIRADGRPVRDVWGQTTGDLRISPTPSPLRTEREVPLLSAPEVFAVYVASRLDRSRDVLIGEHWVYFRLRDGEWFIERGLEPDWSAEDAATGEDLVPLKALESVEQFVTPWKDPGSP